MRGNCWVKVLDLNGRKLFVIQNCEDATEYIMSISDLPRIEARIRLDDACRRQTPLFGQMFLKNPDYVFNRGV